MTKRKAPQPQGAIVNRKPGKRLKRAFQLAIRLCKRRLAKLRTLPKKERARLKHIAQMQAGILKRRQARAKARAKFEADKPRRMARVAKMLARKSQREAAVDRDSIAFIELQEKKQARRSMRHW